MMKGFIPVQLFDKLIKYDKERIAKVWSLAYHATLLA